MVEADGTLTCCCTDVAEVNTVSPDVNTAGAKPTGAKPAGANSTVVDPCDAEVCATLPVILDGADVSTFGAVLAELFNAFTESTVLTGSEVGCDVESVDIDELLSSRPSANAR